MTEARDELLHLIDALPEEKVESLLANARALSITHEPRADRAWPPAFFSSMEHAAGRIDNPSWIEDFVAESAFGADFRG